MTPGHRPTVTTGRPPSDPNRNEVPGKRATYTATQGLVLVAGTRILGIRLHPGATAGALAISAVTHYAADRRVPNGLLQRLARARGKESFYNPQRFRIILP